MTKPMAFIKRHPVLTYVALVFAISWGGMLIAVGPGGIPANRELSEMLVLFAYLAMLAGPSVAGMLLTGLVDGRAGLRELGFRLLRWRVGARWYALALLTAPLVITTVLLALALRSPAFLPRMFITEDKVFLLRFSIVAGLLVGIFEELGWTGFAVPKMRLRYGVLGTGLIVGLIFAAWDFLVVFWVSAATSAAGALPMAIFMPAVLFTWLAPYRVLMVWVYERTHESLLLAMLMHTSLVAFWTILTPLALIGMTLVTYYLVVGAALWVVVAVVAVANHGHLSRQPPLRTRVA